MSCEPVCVCVSLVRAVIICPASTHTALVSSPSLAVLHLPTYIHREAPSARGCLMLRIMSMHVARPPPVAAQSSLAAPAAPWRCRPRAAPPPLLLNDSVRGGRVWSQGARVASERPRAGRWVESPPRAAGAVFRALTKRQEKSRLSGQRQQFCLDSLCVSQTVRPCDFFILSALGCQVDHGPSSA